MLLVLYYYTLYYINKYIITTTNLALQVTYFTSAIFPLLENESSTVGEGNSLFVEGFSENSGQVSFSKLNMICRKLLSL